MLCFVALFSFFLLFAQLAVDDLWYGVDEGTIFGFLGVNGVHFNLVAVVTDLLSVCFVFSSFFFVVQGAGKTTTMSMVTGEFFPTAGTALLNSLDILQSPDSVRRYIGYCPQFDAHFDQLTGREHLNLYARIKGIPEDKLDDVVNAMLDSLKITEVRLCVCVFVY
jgi:ABC-type multidrug transport system ATPase subunit